MLRPDIDQYTDFTLSLTHAKGEVYRAVVGSGQKEDYEIVFRLAVDEAEVTRALATASSTAKMYAQNALSYESIDPLRRIGGLLFSSIFEGRSRSLFARAKEQADYEGNGLRLQIVTGDARLAAMPWEFLHDGQDFLSLSVNSPVVRFQTSASPPRPQPLPEQVRALFVLSDPSRQLDLLPLTDEIRSIAKAFPHFTLDIVRDPSPAQLVSDLRRQEYDMLCMAGTGIETAGGEQVFALAAESAGKEPLMVSASDLSSIVQEQQRLRLVYLCASRTNLLAQAVAHSCPSAIGVRGSFEASSARAFSRGLLPGLLSGMPIEAAVTRGRQQIDAESPGCREWGLPVVYTRTPPGTAVAARAGTAKGSVSVEATPASPSRRLTGKDAERRVMDTRLKMLSINLDSLKQQRAATSGSSSGYIEVQIEQIAREIAEVESKLARMS